MELYSGGGRRLASEQRRRRGGKRLRAARRQIRLLSAALLLLCALPLTSGAPFQSVDPADLPQDPVRSDPAPSREEAASTEPQEPSDAGQTPLRDDGTFLLSFAGDCTLGVEHAAWGHSGTFPEVVGTDYAYPFSNVRELFLEDDFTFVNLECALTDHSVPAEKEYRFRGLPAYGRILKEGGVEAVSLANNHSLDYGAAGLAETRQVLADLSVAAGGDKETFLYVTERGLTVGVYTAYHIGKAEIRQAVESLREQGAQVIVAAFHMGTEGSYAPTAWQRELCRYAAACGAQIVYNSHPHVLQPMERWEGGVILYSMGNFCFGGNRNPSDKDTAVVQVTVALREDGAAEVTDVTAVPCSVSSRSDRNDYRPTPLAPDSPEAARVRSKLDGTFRAPAVQTAPQTAGETAGTEDQTAGTADIIARDSEESGQAPPLSAF